MHLRTHDTKRGFTLIELLIVIAIIGILSGAVLVALNTARTKGNDASIKRTLAQMKRQVELYVDANGNSYANACLDTTANGTKSVYDMGIALANQQDFTYTGNNADAGTMSRVVCHSTASGWAVQAPLKSPPASGTSHYFCIDSRGVVVTTTLNKLAGNATTPDVLCD